MESGRISKHYQGLDIFSPIQRKASKSDLKKRRLLIPQMNRIGGHLLAATFRSFGIDAVVMDTYKGLETGKTFTSGKECFPCQVTMGDIIWFLKKEKERLGSRFDPSSYIYFMPESDGPCRFGMYNKYQRLVLDTFSDLKEVRIASLTFENGYALDGIMEEELIKDFRKAGYLSVIVGDVLDRLLWRIRPYEKREGLADEFIENAMHVMETSFERHSLSLKFDSIIDNLESLMNEARSIIDPSIPDKPLIGIVGEIYLRSHVHANQDIIRKLERYGAEVVNASISEWINYATYDRLREAKRSLRYAIRRLSVRDIKKHLNDLVGYATDLFYQQIKQDRIYSRIRRIIDIRPDHHINELEKISKEQNLYTFDMGTEACLSISGIIKYLREGYDGVVNVYPFTCMPSTITSAIIRPIISQYRVPYLDASYDGSFQPGRESAIRTFMYQAYQHFEKRKIKNH